MCFATQRQPGKIASGYLSAEVRWKKYVRTPLVHRNSKKRCCSIRRYRTIIHGRPRGFAGKSYICCVIFTVLCSYFSGKKSRTPEICREVDSTSHCKQRGIWCAVTMIWRLQGYAMSLRGSQTTTVTTIQRLQGYTMSLRGSQTVTILQHTTKVGSQVDPNADPPLHGCSFFFTFE